MTGGRVLGVQTQLVQNQACVTHACVPVHYTTCGPLTGKGIHIPLYGCVFSNVFIRLFLYKGVSLERGLFGVDLPASPNQIRDEDREHFLAVGL